MSQRLLTNLQEVIKTMPTPEEMIESPQWIGQAQSVLREWDDLRVSFDCPSVSSLTHAVGPMRNKAHTQISALLHEAENDVRRDVEGIEQPALITASGKMFDFYNAVRKVIAGAKKEVFVIDAYLDADFVEYYLPHVEPSASVRLLTGEAYLKTLMPSVKMFSKQHGTEIIVRKSKDFHDRYLLVDSAQGFLCGGSFKDGAAKKPASLIPITDAFLNVQKLYEEIWTKAEVVT